MQIHVVQRGDTLWALARYYSVDINQILTGGKLDSDFAAILLRNPNLQDTLIVNILKIIRAKGYTG